MPVSKIDSEPNMDTGPRVDRALASGTVVIPGLCVNVRPEKSWQDDVLQLRENRHSYLSGYRIERRDGGMFNSMT